MTIDADIKLFCVLGDPVAHSLSPRMHNAAFERAGFKGVYVALRVHDVGAAIAGMRALGIRGASITIPHKVAAVAHVDDPDAAVLGIGAVNTLVNDQGLIRGYNSDCLGAVRALEEKIDLGGRHAAVIGAGGAARAVAFGVLQAGARVTVVNRGRARGENLASDLGADYAPLEDIGRVKADILINTTPVGMHPAVDSTPVPEACLQAGMVVMDAVYNPVKTRLLAAAEARGCRTVDGVAMFIYQGAFQFELWTGQAAPLETMRRSVMAALTGTGADAGKAGESR